MSMASIGLTTATDYLSLADWRRRVAEMWATWREESRTDPAAATERFRAAKDDLFREHPQSPLLPERRGSFRGLAYWRYDPSFRMTGRLESDDLETSAPKIAIPLASSTDQSFSFMRIGSVELEGPLAGARLPVFWMSGYAGGLFIPFRDATSGGETYGAGRYLLDTIKSADHGGNWRDGTLTLDFNMAYHPSCAYDPRWACPLAPPESRLSLPVPVGERLDTGEPFEP